MSKKVLAVVLDKPQAKVQERLGKEYANVFEYSDTFLLVSGNMSVSTNEVAQQAGIKGRGRDATGVVFKLNSAYSGYTSKELWDWLTDVESA